MPDTVRNNGTLAEASLMAILAVCLAFNALGESLRIVLDPTMKGR